LPHDEVDLAEVFSDVDDRDNKRPKKRRKIADKGFSQPTQHQVGRNRDMVDLDHAGRASILSAAKRNGE